MFLLFVCVCFGLCVFLWAVAVSSSTLEREITSFCQPLPVSICCCLLSTGCWPSLSVKGNAVASNPSREPLFDAHWQEPGLWILWVFPCACVIVWRLSHAHRPKQRRCLAAFRNSGLFSPPVRCPPAVCLSCSAPKGNKMQKSFCTDTNGDADYELANNTRGRGPLLTHVYYLRTY